MPRTEEQMAVRAELPNSSLLFCGTARKCRNEISQARPMKKYSHHTSPPLNEVTCLASALDLSFYPKSSDRNPRHRVIDMPRSSSTVLQRITRTPAEQRLVTWTVLRKWAGPHWPSPAVWTPLMHGGNASPKEYKSPRSPPPQDRRPHPVYLPDSLALFTKAVARFWGVAAE
ncbi:hypothetical protein POX_c04404 [Penicillium oxalicum]|uniref:hypothetical protein n=1 Tax=Penicillium oxalicum TaxID=69781 RepID=UPI0020B8B7F1|nr:hypothetical protein POX_c04404 [Penicillium oxalicum]KAI2791543.1 hypothetical protein POX_c04404 [Penicillium oxalicum]